MAIERPVHLIFSRFIEGDCLTSPASGHFTDDTTASYNLFAHYKTPRPFFQDMASGSEDEEKERSEKRRCHHQRRQFELLRGLQMGERYTTPPPAFSTNVQLHRKMFRKSRRFLMLKDGFLFLYRRKKEVDKGRIWRKIDLAHSVVSYRKADCAILINTDDKNELHKFKVGRDIFDSLVEQLRIHRLYRQDQFAGEQVVGEPNTPRSPVTECYPGIPQLRTDFAGLDGDVDSEASKRRVVEWLMESEEIDGRDKECNEATMLIFELGTVIEQLEKCADLASERHSTTNVQVESPKPTRSLFGRLSFRKNRRPEQDQKDNGSPTAFGKTLQVPSSLSSNSFSAGGSTPDVRKLPKSPSASPTSGSKGLAREESDLFHRDTWLREEYLRLAKEAHKKFRTVLRVLNVEQNKLRSMQQRRNDGALETSEGLSGSSASSPIKRPDRIYKFGDNSLTMSLRREALDSSRRLPDKAAPVAGRQLDRPSTVRTSSSVYYDAGETPVISGALPPSPLHSDLDNSYTASDIDEENVEDALSSASVSSSGGTGEEKLATDGDRLQSEDPTFAFPRFRERLPSFMPPAPSVFKLLYHAIGRDFTRLPLPVTAMEPLGMLQVLCEELEYSELIEQAIAASDPYLRIALIAAFAASRYGSTAFRVGRKPFNPLAGETFEFVNLSLGWKYLAEQVTHHPPVSACHAEGKGWTWWQTSEAQVVFGGRSIEARPLSPVYLRLAKWNETYSWNKVTTYLTNLLSGPPFVMDHYGEMVISCQETGTKCKLHFEKMHKQRGNVTGKVFDADGRVVRTIFGKWTDSLYLVTESNSSGRCIWRLAALLPDHDRYYGFTRFGMALNELKPEIHGNLPGTDSRCRPDQRCLENGNTDEAEKLKKTIEARQRERLKTVKEDELALWFRRSTTEDGAKWQFRGDYWHSKENRFRGVDFLQLW